MAQRNMSLKLKLMLLCLFLSGISISVGLISFFGTRTVTAGYERVNDEVLPNIQLADQMYLNFRQVRISLRSLALPGLDSEQAKTYVKNVHDNIASFEEHNRKYQSGVFAPGEKELHKKVESAWDDFKKIGARVLKHHKAGTPEDLQKMTQIFFTECPESARIFDAAMTDLITFQRNNGHAYVKQAREASHKNNTTMTAVIVVGLIAGFGFGVFFAISLSRLMTKMSAELSSGAQQVQRASEQISKSSQSLSQASSEQAASLEETVSTMEELMSMVRGNTANAKQASSLASTTREIAVKGEQEIKVLINSIQDISADSKKIAEITSVIDDIAFQTNLLALNAAVEAARAGEQGKGFAVVAEAVRSLAQRSAESAKNIATLIQNSVEKINQGSRQANQGGEVLAEIVESIKKVADINGEIAAASEEQATGLEQIGIAMNRLDQMTQQNAAASEESAHTSEELFTQSEVLMGNVGALNSIVTGEELKSA